VLETPRNPFSSAKTPQEVRTTVNARLKAISQKLEAVLKQQAGSMSSIGPNESITIVLYLLNTNPADVPDLPGQVQFILKKQDPTQVAIQNF